MHAYVPTIGELHGSVMSTTASGVTVAAPVPVHENVPFVAVVVATVFALMLAYGAAKSLRAPPG